uniref:Uncharacterized protein n=1 Tax=Romanomermis culicivorax TaxID=13658 RepID=A0A915KR54_ROMCU
MQFWEVIYQKKALDILEVEKNLKKKVGYRENDEESECRRQKECERREKSCKRKQEEEKGTKEHKDSRK